MDANKNGRDMQVPTSRLFHSLNSRLILFFLIVSIIPLLGVGIFSFNQSQNALRDEAFNKLIAVRNLKANQVNAYFDDVYRDIQLASRLAVVIRSVNVLNNTLEVNDLAEIRELGFLENPDMFDTETFSYYGAAHHEYHAIYSQIIQIKGYSDILLVSPAGDIIYSYSKRDDFATNLLEGPLQNSTLAEVCRRLLTDGISSGVQITDYSYYPPAGETPVSFIGIPILSQEEIVGLLIYQLSIEQLSELMQDYTGLGQTGETYLVGADGLMRSNSRFFDNDTYLQLSVDTPSVINGLGGSADFEITNNYRSVSVLSAYQPLSIGDLQWVLLAEIEASEAFQAVITLRRWILGILMLTAIGVIVAGFLVAQRLATPLTNLSNVVTRIAEGQLDLSVPIKGTIETKRLAYNFNIMTERLRDLFASLKQRIAEHEKTEAALRESETTNRALLEAVPDAIFQLDHEGTYLSFVSAPCFKPFLPPEEFVGKKQQDVMPPHLSKQLQNSLEQAIQTETLQTFEYPIHKDTESEYFEARIVRMGSDKVLGMVRDITNRKQAEDALRASEIRYRSLFEHSPISLWEEDFSAIKHEIDQLKAKGIEDFDTYFQQHPEIIAHYIDLIKVTDVNQAALTLYGVDNKQLLQNVADISISDEITYLLRKALVAFIKGQTSFLSESSQLTLSGEKFHVFGNTMILPDFENTWSRVIVSSIDITERKLAEKTLKESEENLRITINSIGDAVISTDINGVVTRMNLVAEELTGWKREEAIGRSLTEVFHIVNERTRELAENPVEKVLETGIVVGLANHTALVAKDGAEYLIADSGAPIRDAEGDIIGVVLVFRDVTEELRTEQELLKVKKLESIGTLAGGIAHDFNNLLTGLFGNIELAKVFLDTDHKAYKYIEFAWRSLESAANLTNQLLTFSRGGQPIKDTLSIGEVITETAQFSVRGSKAKLVTKIVEDLWLVEADKGQISQVISNLVINAEQAMPMGGAITIEATNAETEVGKFVKIIVQDTGIGIAPQYTDKIFDPYFTTKHDGSGLGLATTHSIIMKHDGRITVDSKIDQGTTFTIYLPAADKIKGVNLKSNEDGQAKIVSSGRILVMDDEEVVRQVIGGMLTNLGYEVVYTVDGQAAIDEYLLSFEKGTPYDLIITDLTIPGGVGGQAAAEEILKIHPDAKIIASSGYTTNSVMANYKKYGFMGIITKPFRIEDLQKVVQKVLEM